MTPRSTTSDNLQLSGHSERGSGGPVQLTAHRLGFDDYVAESLSHNTRRAFRSDLADFTEWGGGIPCSDVVLAQYVADRAAHLKVASLSRRLASISKAHRLLGAPSPCSSEVVRATLRGIKRVHGTAQHQAKPLMLDQLFLALSLTGPGIKDVRDRALLLVGFAAGFRRSELVGLDVEDIEYTKQGLILHLRRSKTDQTGSGRKIGVPYGRSKWCPVSSMRDWLSAASITEGPVFRCLQPGARLSDRRLSSQAVSIIIKARVSAAGFDPTSYSGHSLRAGFVTSAAQAGVSSWKIRAQTGHSSEAMLSRYIRETDLFTANAAAALF